jgi:acyl carrier protein
MTIKLRSENMQSTVNKNGIKQLIYLISEVMDNEKIAEKISPESDLINDIGMDSLTIINFILRVEDEFNIEIDFDEFDVTNLRSLNTFQSYIEARQG